MSDVLDMLKQMYRLLNSNQVLAAKHFQNQVEFFFKVIALDCPLGKIQYTVCVDFRVDNAQVLTSRNKGEYLALVNQIVFLPDRNENPELHDLLKSRAVGNFFMVVDG